MAVKNRKSITVITPQSSAVPLISLAEMKAFLRVDTAADDALIEDFVKVATESVAQFLQRSIVSQTLELTMDGFGNGNSVYGEISAGEYELPVSFARGDLQTIDLPFLPIVSITSIKTYDQANAEATLSSAAYTLDANGGRVYLNSGYNWPSSLRDRASVKIRYVAGYGYTNVPLPIRQAVRQHAAAMYDCRRMCDMTPEMVSMVSPYRILDRLGFQ